MALLAAHLGLCAGPHDEQLLLTPRVDRQLDWRDIACIFEPEAEDLTCVSATLRKRFQRLKEQLRSQVPTTAAEHPGDVRT